MFNPLSVLPLSKGEPLKRETTETLVAIAILALMFFLALFMLHGCGKHPPAAEVLVATQREHVEPVHVTPSKDTGSPAPGIVVSVAAGQPYTKPAHVNASVSLTPDTSHLTPARVAVLGAEWCGPCKRLEREVLPDLRDLNLQLIDVDTEADLAAKLFSPKSNAIPQFVLIDGSGPAGKPYDWLIGYQSAERVRKFLQQPAPKPVPESAHVAGEPEARTKTAFPLHSGSGQSGQACTLRGTAASGLRRLFPRCQ